MKYINTYYSVNNQIDRNSYNLNWPNMYMYWMLRNVFVSSGLSVTVVRRSVSTSISVSTGYAKGKEPWALWKFWVLNLKGKILTSYSVTLLYFVHSQRLSTANEEIIEVLLSKQQLLPALRWRNLVQFLCFDCVQLSYFVEYLFQFGS